MLYTSLGYVFILGDLNAHIGKKQAQPIGREDMEKEEQVELDPLWERISVDNEMNVHGHALHSVMQMMVLNDSQTQGK